MFVYIVVEWVAHEGGTVERVYDNARSAIRFKRERNRWLKENGWNIVRAFVQKQEVQH